MAEEHAGTLDLLGGCLCLDFVNTVDWHASDHPHEWLHDYSDLLAWGRHAGALEAARAESLANEALLRPAEARAVLERAIVFREALYRLFLAVIGGEAPTTEDLAALNAELPRAFSRLRLAQSARGFGWEWEEEPAALDQVLWPIAQSAAELLISSRLNELRVCDAERCGWLFLDLSRNRSRRWCDMRSCGNRAKARRHYQRRRAASTQ